VAELLEHGAIRRGYLGIGVRSVRLTEAVAAETEQAAGSMIVAIEPESPAAAAGLHLGDIVLTIADKPTPHVRRLIGALRSLADQTVEVRVLRAGRVETAELSLGSR
jgi:S1-C subfamily serine protease